MRSFNLWRFGWLFIIFILRFPPRISICLHQSWNLNETPLPPHCIHLYNYQFLMISVMNRLLPRGTSSSKPSPMSPVGFWPLSLHLLTITYAGCLNSLQLGTAIVVVEILSLDDWFDAEHLHLPLGLKLRQPSHWGGFVVLDVDRRKSWPASLA